MRCTASESKRGGACSAHTLLAAWLTWLLLLHCSHVFYRSLFPSSSVSCHIGCHELCNMDANSDLDTREGLVSLMQTLQVPVPLQDALLNSGIACVADFAYAYADASDLNSFIAKQPEALWESMQVSDPEHSPAVARLRRTLDKCKAQASTLETSSAPAPALPQDRERTPAGRTSVANKVQETAGRSACWNEPRFVSWSHAACWVWALAKRQPWRLQGTNGSVQVMAKLAAPSFAPQEAPKRLTACLPCSGAAAL